MDPERPLLIRLDSPTEHNEQTVGGKAAKLAQLTRAGFTVPRGFCLTTWAYEAFVEEAEITTAIHMELGRKSMDDMRWEEIWDAALRIRSTFLSQPLSDLLRETVAEGMKVFDSSTRLAIRSSAVGEDSAGRSFAGLHDSILEVCGQRAIEDAVRLVWASLWSDAALLYRKELGLDPARSRMAVLVQEMVDADRSGVAFAHDPREAGNEHAIIEAVPGSCSLLVDGLVDPDRWEVHRQKRHVITWRAGQREGSDGAPLLETRDLQAILRTLLSIEQLFRWPPDMEWTGRSDSFTVLQARPITTATPDNDKQRSWYLSLRPGDALLRELRKRVANELIPALIAEGDALAGEELDLLDDRQLADSMEKRSAAVAKWKKIYWDEFIPFAHGVRRLATYYNDAVKPDDPYEFVGLLRDQPLLATQRNRLTGELAQQLAANLRLRTAVQELLTKHAHSFEWSKCRAELLQSNLEAERFLAGFDDLNERFLDITFDNERIHDCPAPLLRILCELSQRTHVSTDNHLTRQDAVCVLEERLLNAVGPERHAEASDMMEMGRVSWKLRDDDNLLVSRLESQQLRALIVAAKRLRDLGRLTGARDVNESHSESLVEALRRPTTHPLKIETVTESRESNPFGAAPGETPRQLIGQPASPGVATGSVRCVRGRGDLGNFQRGEVLVCDAIQPTMTHLVPLASAIVERRGGMLIHGAIIARELAIPCVNGVRGAAEILKNGDLVTVDGHLGIVTVGAAEFDLELHATNL